MGAKANRAHSWLTGAKTEEGIAGIVSGKGTVWDDVAWQGVKGQGIAGAQANGLQSNNHPVNAINARSFSSSSGIPALASSTLMVLRLSITFSSFAVFSCA